jgi:hypothetical protein
MNSLPFGTLDLDPHPYVVAGAPRRIRCYVRGCKGLLRPPGREYPGEVCPVHGIRCHFSRNSATYSYVDVRRNIIVAPDLFATRVVGNPFKYPSNYLGNEKSEDALTWNVFRTLQECGLLHLVARWITGLEIPAEPRLYLWGLSVSDETFEPWNLLTAARERFESNLPVERPTTEPDIALYLPGRYLILIEAKFTSPNPFYIDGPRRDPCSLTKNELLDLYQDQDLRMLDVEKARRAKRVYYQLWRNLVFAEWMALTDGCGTPAYLANLTRAGHRADDGPRHLHQLLRAGFQGRFTHFFWENIHGLAATRPVDLSLLMRYLETKTAALSAAFPSTQRRNNMAKLYLRHVDGVQLGCYSERGLLSYFMSRVLPVRLTEFLKLAQTDDGNCPFAGMEQARAVTLLSELDFGNEGFGKPDGAISFRHNDRQFLILIEVKLNHSYQASCEMPAYNSTIRGQLELKWRLMKLFTSDQIKPENNVRYVVENDDMIHCYKHHDPMYPPNVNVANLGRGRRRRLRLVEGVGDFFRDYVEPCAFKDIFYLALTRDDKNPLDGEQNLRPLCCDENGQIVNDAIQQFCWINKQVLEDWT